MNAATQNASIVVRTETLDVQEIAIVFGQHPSEVYQYKHKTGLRQIGRPSTYIFESGLEELAPLDSHVRRLAQLLSGRKDAIAQVRDKIDLSVTCVFRLSDDVGGFSLSGNLLSAIAGAESELLLDVYGPEFYELHDINGGVRITRIKLILNYTINNCNTSYVNELIEFIQDYLERSNVGRINWIIEHEENLIVILPDVSPYNQEWQGLLSFGKIIAQCEQASRAWKGQLRWEIAIQQSCSWGQCGLIIPRQDVVALFSYAPTVTFTVERFRYGALSGRTGL